jgi:hypothetical protein
MHEMLSNTLPPAPAGIAAGCVVQRLPFQRSATATGTPERLAADPTARQPLVDQHEIPFELAARDRRRDRRVDDPVRGCR